MIETGWFDFNICGTSLQVMAVSLDVFNESVKYASHLLTLFNIRMCILGWIHNLISLRVIICLAVNRNRYRNSVDAFSSGSMFYHGFPCFIIAANFAVDISLSKRRNGAHEIGHVVWFQRFFPLFMRTFIGPFKSLRAVQTIIEDCLACLKNIWYVA